MYNTIIFDLDGTLLDTLDDLMNSVNYILNKYNFPLRNKKEIRSFLGNGIKHLLKLSAPSEISEEYFEKIFLDFKEYYTNHCRIKTKPYYGIMDMLKILKNNGYKTAIVSNKNDAAVKKLAKYYFDDYISTAIGEQENVKRKPAPDTVNAAMDFLHVTDKNTVLYVGDSEVDKQTSDNAGIDCVLVDWGFRDREDLLELNSKYIISSPEELLNII